MVCEKKVKFHSSSWNETSKEQRYRKAENPYIDFEVIRSKFKVTLLINKLKFKVTD